MARSVQTFRVSRDLLRKAAKLDGLRPAEWARLVIERAARERVAQAARDAAASRLLRDLRDERFQDDDVELVEWANRVRHER
jgi:hypothetical protein